MFGRSDFEELTNQKYTYPSGSNRTFELALDVDTPEEVDKEYNRMASIDNLKGKADYRRSEIASKKMLSNVSHDIKTPMTVVLGYLEIMRINGTGTDEMLRKTEQKANSVMELIN